MHLEAETSLFDSSRADWIAEGRDGMYVVIHGDSILGFFDTLGAAYMAGAKEFTPGKFLVKQVAAQDDVQVIHRVAWGSPVGS